MEHDEISARAKDYVARESDDRFKAEVETLLEREDWKELEDRFYRDLEFGTAGLRGMIGGGYNRMNSLVLRRATQGISDYLIKTFPGKKLSACLAYDSRHYSPEFAQDAASVFAANGIKAFLFSSLRPTPLLSFAIRRLGADTGVVVTASHNPPAYNGYKAYWNDGAQISEPHDKNITAMVEAVDQAKVMTPDEAKAKGLLVMIDREIDEAYDQMLRSKLFRPELIRQMASKVRIVYTPLHGTGALPFERVMKSLGLSVITVPEQREPDGSFPTLAYPNPEEPAALKMALDLGRTIGADVVMANDPDADRLGIAVPDGAGDFALITGNQLGALHLDYIIISRKEFGLMPPRPVCIKSIVTTDLQAAIAEEHGVLCKECLTGFKWIAALMRSFETPESEGKGLDFIYGTEESYGHIIETEVRDKDGISAAALTAEMTLYWRSKGSSLLQRLDELYRAYGFYEERGVSKYFEGSAGMETMRGIMAGYRKHQPTLFGGLRVKRIRDIQTGLEWEAGRPESATKIDLPTSDVIHWRLEDGTSVIVRPSGTEPKIKYYILSRTDVADGLEAARAASKKKVAAIEAEIRKAVGA